MIKFNQILCLVMVLFFVSCEKDNMEGTEAQLTGTWKATSVQSDNGEITTTSGSTTTNTTFSFLGKDIDTKVSFNADNTFTSEGTYVQELTTTTNGQTSMQDIEISDFSLPGTWEATKTTITITQESTGEVQVSEILNLTDTSLEFKYEISNTQTTPDFTSTTTATIFYTLEKE